MEHIAAHSVRIWLATTGQIAQHYRQLFRVR
jgi:hypothetical protein